MKKIKLETLTKKLFVIIAFIYQPSHCDPTQSPSKCIMQQVDNILDKIPEGELQRVLILREKRKIVEGFIQAYQSSENESKPVAKDLEAIFYEPHMPEELAEDQKMINLQERIATQYIGDIPSQVQDVIFYFNNFDECQKNNIEIYNRLLLHGHPGTGKSYLFKVLSHELQIPSMSFSASFFADKYIGESSRRIRKAFEVAKNFNKPVLIFIDEIDALASKRKNNTHEEHRATLITLLTELQDLQSNKNIFVFAATNDLEALDPAIKDRFAGAVCEIKELDLKYRAALFKKVFAEKNHKIDDKLAHRLAEVTNAKKTNTETGQSHYVFSNRDIEYIVTTALLKKFADCKKDPNNCSKHICTYLRQALDATGKKGHFTWYATYCDGI